MRSLSVLRKIGLNEIRRLSLFMSSLGNTETNCFHMTSEKLERKIESEKERLFAGGQEDQMDTSAVGFTSSSSSLTSSSQMSHRNDDNNSNTTVTFVKATLGREASIHCIAEHLVGQKTVSFQFQRGLKKTS